jgi:hypothetical protein
MHIDNFKEHFKAIVDQRQRALLQRSNNHQLGNASKVSYYFTRPFTPV